MGAGDYDVDDYDVDDISGPGDSDQGEGTRDITDGQRIDHVSWFLGPDLSEKTGEKRSDQSSEALNWIIIVGVGLLFTVCLVIILNSC
jgi:hypothetical protein